MTPVSKGHTVNRFDNDLNHIARSVDRMGELALDQLERALTTLHDEDPSKAQAVTNRDQLLNELDVEIDNLIIRLITTRQPKANDLREIVVLGKVVIELERAGDEARKIAGLTVLFYQREGHPPSEQIPRDIHSMAGYVRDMMAMAMLAFTELDIARAIKVPRMDNELDNEFRSTLRRMSTFVMEDSRNIGHFVDIILGIRALDRYGVHAKNIAGHIIFLAKGTDVRHLSAEEIITIID